MNKRRVEDVHRLKAENMPGFCQKVGNISLPDSRDTHHWIMTNNIFIHSTICPLQCFENPYQVPRSLYCGGKGVGDRRVPALCCARPSCGRQARDSRCRAPGGITHLRPLPAQLGQGGSLSRSVTVSQTWFSEGTLSRLYRFSSSQYHL